MKKFFSNNLNKVEESSTRTCKNVFAGTPSRREKCVHSSVPQGSELRVTIIKGGYFIVVSDIQLLLGEDVTF
jgi:hypothetical protein